MIIKHIQSVIKRSTNIYKLGNLVTKDTVNYYDILQVDQAATQQNITNAYKELVSPLTPERDTERFNQLNQAFVILTDNKTRDAYDSLLKVKKTYYLSQEQGSVPSTRSYLALRKLEKSQQLKKKINIDQFGRYKGGLPQKRGQLRGKSLGQTGVLHRLVEVQEQLDRFPQFHNIDTEKAESFKNFHANQRQAREMKWPWFTFEVDYNFLNFSKFRRAFWPKIQFLVFFLYILPTFYYAFEKYEKQQLTLALKQKSKKSQSSNHENQVKAQSH